MIRAFALRKRTLNWPTSFGGSDPSIDHDIGALRFLEHVLPRGFHKIRYYGLWHASKRSQSHRAWVLLILRKPTGATGAVKIADVLEAVGQLVELTDQALENNNDDTPAPRCPSCGSAHTTLLGQWPSGGVP